MSPQAYAKRDDWDRVRREVNHVTNAHLLKGKLNTWSFEDREDSISQTTEPQTWECD